MQFDALFNKGQTNVRCNGSVFAISKKKPMNKRTLLKSIASLIIIVAVVVASFFYVRHIAETSRLIDGSLRYLGRTLTAFEYPDGVYESFPQAISRLESGKSFAVGRIDYSNANPLPDLLYPESYTWSDHHVMLTSENSLRPLIWCRTPGLFGRYCILMRNGRTQFVKDKPETTEAKVGGGF